MENPISPVPLVRVEDLLAGLENDYPRGHPGRANYCAELADICRMLHESSNDNSVFNALVHAASEAGSSPRSTGHLDLVEAESVATPSTSCDGLDIEMDCSEASKPLVRVEELLAGLEKNFPRGHPGRAKYCDELTGVFRMLHETSGDDSAYAALVHVEGEASSLRASERASEKAEEFAKFLFTLAMRNKLPELLSSVRTDGEELSGCIDLSALLKTSSADDEDDHPLAPVIASQRAALREHPAGHPDRPYLCEQLAQNLIARHNEDKDTEYLEEVRRLLLDACQLAPPHRVWKYACELSEVHLQHSSADQVDAAIRALHQAVAYQPDDPAGVVHRIIQSLGVIHQRTEDAAERYHSVLAHIYERLIRLLPLLLHPVLRDDIPPQALPRCNQLGYDAFVNAVIGNNIPAALELLEAVQSTTLRQRIHRRDPEFDNIPEHMSVELEQLLQSTVHASDGNQPGSEVKLFERSERLYTLIREIRALPGMDRFMLGEAYTQLRTVASNNHPVVVLVGAREHFYALILQDPSQGPILLPLHLSQGELEACSTDMRSQRPHRGTMVFLKPPVDLHRAQGSPSSPQRSLNQQLRFMWLQIVKPVFDKLGLRMSRGHDRIRIHWCATGPFSSLPLHAAGIYDGLKSEKACCDDFVVSSYTPTLTALLWAQRTSTPLTCNHASLTLVAEKQAQEPNLPMIPGVIRELGAIVSTTQGKSVQVVNQLADSTIITNTLGVMKATNIVHLACHGVQDVNDAAQSGFCLGDGRLTICNMMDSHLKHGFLAYLSACETGKSAKDQSDHATILATSVLSTGFSNVIATMWSISDRDGPEVAKWFYEELLASDVINADVVAYALDAAVGKLRDSGVPTNRWVPFIHMGA